MVPILAESLVWMWRMMKVGWSVEPPDRWKKHSPVVIEGLRVLQLKLARGHSDPAIGLSGPQGVMRQRGENCHRP